MIDNQYAMFLQSSGEEVFISNNIFWHKYNGFIVPAYLPHVTPTIDEFTAKKAMKYSKSPFARWNSSFGQNDEASWWYVVRQAPYSMQQCSKKTRSNIRRAIKNLIVRPVSLDEMQEQGYAVCEAAVVRYGNSSFLPSRAEFSRRLTAAGAFYGTVEYVGVFVEEKMIAFSENHIQDNAVFWESIWYDPEYLRLGSSYALIHFMLEYYLNTRNMKHVSDGCRSLYHETNFQDFLIRRFGFEKFYSKLELVYSPWFYFIVSLLYPFRCVLDALRACRAPILAKGRAVLCQEEIRRSFL